jgi:ArsR family transcriptional regulator
VTDERCTCASGQPAPVAQPSPEADAAADAVFKALASAPRRHLLRIIASRTSGDGGCCPAEVCACELADALELAPSTISHHMSALVSAGLVTATKRGLWVYYGLERGTLSRAAEELLAL